jgi:hypothetical protein
MVVEKEIIQMKWRLAILLNLALILMLTVSTWTQPAGTGTATVVENAVIAASCSSTHVQAALNAATEGDTVLIPAGTCNWSTQVSWTAPANVTVRGAGSLTTMGGGDVTVIVDNYTTNAPLLETTIASTGVFRMTGITFQGGTGGLKDWGMLRFNGPGTMRLDHLHLNTHTHASNVNKVFTLVTGIKGVLDNSIIDLDGDASIYLYAGINQTDTPWSQPTDFGSGDYFFFEDNQFNGNVAKISSRTSDCFSASRLTVRFNTLKYASGPEVHATGHAGDNRGCRSMESYNNQFSQAPGQGGSPSTYAYDMHDASSGTSLIWGNTADANTLSNFVLFNVTRKNGDTYPSIPATPSGWGYCGTTHTGTGSNWDGNTDTALGYPCIDQPGRGQGQLLTGLFPSKINNVTGTIAWPNQALEPIYVWMVSGTAVSNFYANNTLGRVVANRDYYPQASGIQTSSSSPFDGTTGTGWGTLANRPATCTTGVGYFATDQGSWNTSTTNTEGVQRNGADGVLYTCTSTNTWTLYYTPYTYPHPLRGAS